MILIDSLSKFHVTRSLFFGYIVFMDECKVKPVKEWLRTTTVKDL